MTEPVGEDAWLALVDEASRTTCDLEQRVGVVELYKQSITAEPWSNKLWLAYCEWFWSLHTDCQNGDAGWPEEEQALGQELFSLQTALDIWRGGAQQTQYRLNDSHELWTRWMSIELDLLSQTPNQQNIERVRQLFLDRLQTPHSTWEETSQMLSQFISKYDESSYETTMIQTTKLAQPAKDLYSQREIFEASLQRVDSSDANTMKSELRRYLEWETEQFLKRHKKGVTATPLILSIALYERALASTQLGLDSATWEDYLVFIMTVRQIQPQAQLPPLLSVTQRATSHCPWSGSLWAKYILCAESEKLPFETMERIKHAATNTQALDRDGMAGVVEFYVAWSGYLKRRTMVLGATDEDVDIAEMGLPTALESVEEWGQRRHGAEWKGDPLFRIERIVIQYLTQKGSFQEARGYWTRLVKIHASSYEFWQQYYLWEMTIRTPNQPPSHATDVLVKALHQKSLDWPEKLMEIYIRHCNNYEEVDALLKALSTVRRKSKAVAKRREEEAGVIYAQRSSQDLNDATLATESPTGASKRKRDDDPEDARGAAKKVKNAAEQDALREQYLKRDRENTTVIVTNLPSEATQTKVRQYFKEYGHINSITLKSESDKSSSIGLIEFRTPEDVQSALLRDMKFFGDRQITVKPGTGLTLYVTNYPPTADDAYLRKLFKDCGEIFSIRWPSLKHNTHRRFCYISFKTTDAASAATRLDGLHLGGIYKLTAKYSDPSNRKDREGAMAEGREVHITGVDFAINEGGLKEVFSKYGKVDRCRILKTLAGDSKGAAFISFETREQATAALEMDKTKLKSRILTVELSTGKNFKPTATSIGVSPGPSADKDNAMSPSPAPDSHGPLRAEIADREVVLMNIPDTVNDARIRAIAEPFGPIVRLVLRPDHQGAIIEFADVASAGNAALGLENHIIAPGRNLRIGTKKELFAEKDEVKTDRIFTGQGKKQPAALLKPGAPVRRPGPGGRGGLGVKRGLGSGPFKSAAKSMEKTGEVNGDGNANGEQNLKPKSNADFKAMFISGGSQSTSA